MEQLNLFIFINNFINLNYNFYINNRRLSIIAKKQMEELQEIVRCKKTFKLTPIEFLEGEWLKEVRAMYNYDRLDALFVGNRLIVRFYKKENKKNGEYEK